MHLERKAGSFLTSDQRSCEGLVRLLPLLEGAKVEVTYPSRHTNVSIKVPLREVPACVAIQHLTPQRLQLILVQACPIA